MATSPLLIPALPARSRRWLAMLVALLLALPLAGGCGIVDAPAPRAEDAAQVDDDDDDGDPVPVPGDPVEEPDYTVTDGCDHALPDWVEAEDFAGYVDHPDHDQPGIGNAYRNWWTSWADLEPARGEYAWDRIEQRLAEAEAGGYRICLQLRNVVCGGGNADRGVTIPSAVPDWVFTEFGLGDDDIVDLGGDWGLEVIPAWRRDVSEAFCSFIRALGEQGFPQREALGAVYVHGISPSRGEEFWLDPHHVDILEAEAGLSAAVLEDWIVERLDAHAAAFGADVHKLAWVGLTEHWRYSGADYADAAWNIVQHAWSLGAGNRASIVEKYHISLNEPALGQSIDDQGYLHTDESIPPLATVRYFGDENEEYGESWNWRYGGVEGEWQRYRLAMLRALQMQVRFLWTTAHAEELDPDLSTYARYAMGKTVATSPDAWCYLKESAVSTAVTPAGVVRNFERWLYQRDVPGGVTVPAERYDRAFNAGNILDGADGAFHDMVARRTDRANAEPCIYFDLDDRFVTSGPVAIKVEVVDADTTSWRLEYADQAGVLTSTDAYAGPGDGAVRTVTFTLDDARFAGDLPQGMDFRLACDGPNDVVVRWVRLVRTVRP
jgi:hypothetical protein